MARGCAISRFEVARENSPHHRVGTWPIVLTRATQWHRLDTWAGTRSKSNKSSGRGGWETARERPGRPDGRSTPRNKTSDAATGRERDRPAVFLLAACLLFTGRCSAFLFHTCCLCIFPGRWTKRRYKQGLSGTTVSYSAKCSSVLFTDL